MSVVTTAVLLVLGTLLVTAVSINGQIFLAPAGSTRPVSNSCPQSAKLSRIQNQAPYVYPMNVLVALEQFNQDNNSNGPPELAPAQSPEPRCRSEPSRVFTKLFSIPGAVADSLLSGEIII